MGKAQESTDFLFLLGGALVVAVSVVLFVGQSALGQETSIGETLKEVKDILGVSDNGSEPGIQNLECDSFLDCNSEFSQSYCLGKKIARDFNTFECGNSGTQSSFCDVNFFGTEILEECESYCDNAECVSEPPSGTWQPSPTCADPDGLDTNTLGSCLDSRGYSEDFCSGNEDIMEYYCLGDYCAVNPLFCGEGMKCFEGECIPESVCADSDSGINIAVFGECSDSTGSYSDSCSEESVTEYYCSGNSCASETIACSAGYSCSGGICSANPVSEFEIDSCGYVISEPGNYFVSGDMNNFSAVCITINTSGNVLIDCQGNKIIGNPSIYVGNASDVSIKDCAMGSGTWFYSGTGIVLAGSSPTHVSCQGSTGITGAVFGYSFLIEDAANKTISECNILNSMVGVAIINSSGIVLEDNVFLSYLQAVGIIGGGNNIIRRNTVFYRSFFSSGGTGIGLQHTNGNSIVDNYSILSTNSPGTGIALSDSNYNTISNNNVDGQYDFDRKRGEGIKIISGMGNLILGNTVCDQSQRIEINTSQLQNPEGIGSNYCGYCEDLSGTVCPCAPC